MIYIFRVYMDQNQDRLRHPRPLWPSTPTPGGNGDSPDEVPPDAPFIRPTTPTPEKTPENVPVKIPETPKKIPARVPA